jgi:protein-tyrosine phosphatase
LPRKEWYEIPGPWKGKLAISPRPRAGDWLDDEIEGWKGSGFTLVVSLLTPEEEAALDLQLEASRVRKAGLAFVSHPVPDRDVPASRSDFGKLVEEVAVHLNSGGSALVHCRMGIGRSSLVAAALLIAGVSDASSAWQIIEKARGLPVPDTAEQRQWLQWLERNS